MHMPKSVPQSCGFVGCECHLHGMPPFAGFQQGAGKTSLLLDVSPPTLERLHGRHKTHQRLGARNRERDSDGFQSVSPNGDKAVSLHNQRPRTAGAEAWLWCQGGRCHQGVSVTEPRVCSSCQAPAAIGTVRPPPSSYRRMPLPPEAQGTGTRHSACPRPRQAQSPCSEGVVIVIQPDSGVKRTKPNNNKTSFLADCFNSLCPS